MRMSLVRSVSNRRDMRQAVGNRPLHPKQLSGQQTRTLLAYSLLAREKSASYTHLSRLPERRPPLTTPTSTG